MDLIMADAALCQLGPGLDALAAKAAAASDVTLVTGRAAAISGQLVDPRADLSRLLLGAIVMRMPTLEIDKALLAKAQQLTGLRGKAAVLNAGLEALIARESGRQLIALGATERELRAAPRRRQRATRSGA
jgi:Arc/MetJ family transcription regulator